MTVAACPDVYDELLDAHAAYNPIIPPGVSDHGPMVFDELVAAGQDDLARTWHSEYITLLDQMPPRARDLHPVRAGDFGNTQLIGDWVDLFDRQLATTPWDDIARLWLPRLLPGLFTDIGHGPIRTAHIVRRLEQHDTAPRRHELAVALAAWAATYTEVQATDNNGSSDRAVFVDLAHRGATTYLAARETNPIGAAHCLTLPAAMLALADYLEPSDVRRAAALTSAACAAIGGGFWGEHPETTFHEREPWPCTLQRAADGGDEHAIKLSAAANRLHQLEPDRVYAAAAADISHRLRARWRP